MLKKRIIATIVVKDSIAVQSFSYKKWLPIGKPKCLAENFNRWGADEIVLLSTDREGKGPDIKLIKEISELGLTTPFTYGGGIRNIEDAIKVINSGAERIVLDSLIFKNESIIEPIAECIGIQAILASVPLIQKKDKSVLHFNHLSKKVEPINSYLKNIFDKQNISEIILIDKENEGSFNGFNENFISEIKKNTTIPLLAFGGIVNPKQISKLLLIDQVSGILIGNSLNYKEHAIKNIKIKLNSQQIRTHKTNSF